MRHEPDKPPLGGWCQRGHLGPMMGAPADANDMARSLSTSDPRRPAGSCPCRSGMAALGPGPGEASRRRVCEVVDLAC